MPPSVQSLLERKRTEAINEWVFPHYMNPSEPLHPDSAYKKLKTLLKHADLPLIRFHDLRHTFATHAMKGVCRCQDLIGSARTHRCELHTRHLHPCNKRYAKERLRCGRQNDAKFYEKGIRLWQNKNEKTGTFATAASGR